MDDIIIHAETAEQWSVWPEDKVAKMSRFAEDLFFKPQ